MFKKSAVQLLGAVLLLNALIGFEAVWPTVWVKPTLKLGPDLLVLMLLMAAWTVWRGRLGQRVLSVLSGFYLLLVVGHYADMVVPNLLGRPINLYWDLPQLPRFVWVSAKGLPWWMSVLAAVALVVFVLAVYRAIHWGFSALADGLWTYRQTVRLWVFVLPLSAVACANYAGVESTWQVVCKPVVPTYWKEAVRLWDAFSPTGAASLLPASTVVDVAMAQPPGTVLTGLKQRDVMLMLLETYGAMLYDQPDANAAVAGSRRELERAIEQHGRHVVSAFYTSPTVGGASDLAHMSVLSGIDLNLHQPRKFDVLMTTERPTLLQVFQREGYEVVGLYHSVFWDWVERSFYRFDRYISGPDLQYTGPAFGFWKIPDQYALAKYAAQYPVKPGDKPRLTVFPTISTHFPFYQVPPYQPDWKRVLSDTPFDPVAAARAQAEQVNWANMRPDYLRTINYCHQWLAGYFEQPEQRDTVYVMLGDHQPTGSVTGPDASWDVPVFVVASDPALLNRFKQLGFSEGLTPAQRKPLGGLHDLTATLLKAFGPESIQP
ncbi:MAG TPA: sulfatase-like hydrolase/transferase [Limnobacter sp.]|uniref:sulfatase-like hydrolase/transferase n=1 Tax=Limnobacter sp. TaxID=2003368 RepID=UPI002EDAECA2